MANTRKMKKAKRTVVLLEEEDHRYLQHTALDLGVPMAELIRRAVKNLRSSGNTAEFLKRAVTARKAVRP